MTPWSFAKKIIKCIPFIKPLVRELRLISNESRAVTYSARVGFDKNGNFGDELNAALLDRLLAEWRHVAYAKCNLVPMGSILHNLLCERSRTGKSYYDYIDVWGTGLIKSIDGNPSFCRDVIFRSLRGKRTQENVERILGRNIAPALGDPGLLTSRVIAESKSKKYLVGVVLHFVDKQSEYKRNILISESIAYIDVSDNPLVVAEQISSCRCILSSSLHGLIIADSYGIPSARLVLSDEIIGGDFKYTDYYSVYNDESYTLVDLRKETIDKKMVLEIIGKAPNRMIEVEKIQQGLMDSFPRKWCFDLHLGLLQNIRLLMALSEFDSDILVDVKFKPILDHLSKYFIFHIGFFDKEKFETKRSLSIDHENATVCIGEKSHPLVFPRSMIEWCVSRWGRRDKITFYGLKTEKRVRAIDGWLKRYMGGAGNAIRSGGTSLKIEVKYTANGRRLPGKAFDENYYRRLCNSGFSLCPDGDFIWTYRFFESVICGSIPVIENECDLYKGFRYYTMETVSNRLVYRADWADENLHLLKARHCLVRKDLYWLDLPVSV